MKSKITIEIDFDKNNCPFIQVINDRTTDDVRDKLVTAFLQSFGGTSEWCRVDFKATSDLTSVLNIYPITPDNLEKESELINLRKEVRCN